LGLTLLNLRRGNAPLEERSGMVMLTLQDAAREANRLAEENKVVAKTEEALSPQFFALNSTDPEDPRFRRLTSQQTLRDLNPLMQERMQQICFYLKATTLFGKRFVNLIGEWVVGEGFDPVAKDADVQAVIDRFWDDPINRLDKNLKELIEEESTFGELCIPVAVNPIDGFVRLGYIDPQEIDAVEYGALTTGDGQQEISIPIAVRMKKRIGESQQRRLSIIRPDEDPYSPTFGQLIGDCFYFAINKAKAASRGISDLFAAADWIDIFDQAGFDYADRIRFLNQFVWQYVFKGADQKTVDEKQKQLTKRPPRQGGIWCSNENTEIKAVTPDLKAADMSEAMSMMKKYIAGGQGFSTMFLGDPVDANRSTAQEMEGPTGKMLTVRQQHAKEIVLSILAFVLDRAIDAGVLSENVDRTNSLQVPDLQIKDMQRAGQTLQQIGISLQQAQEQGWIRGETAARGYHTIMTQIGVEVDSKEEYAAAQQELADRRAGEINDLADQTKLAAQLKELQDAGGAVQ
jgi:hypothetical protein